MRGLLNTRTLMTCVAIALVGGMIGFGAGYLAAATSLVFPPAFGLVAGTMIFPAVIAMRLLRVGGTGLLTTALSGLVGVLIGPYGWGAMAIVPFGLVLEAAFAIGRYRRWSVWRYYVGTVVGGLLYTVGTFIGYGYGAFGWWLQVLAFVLPTLSMVAFTAIGIAVADRLRQAGVGPRTRVAAAEQDAARSSEKPSP